jgi:hypothetical protein
MLRPPDQPKVARRCQRALLASLGIDGKRLVEPVDPQTQFDTGISRPDLVMHFEKLGFVLVVEAKTGSDEHETPDGVMQCRAYPPHVRNKLRLDHDYPVKVVYLTPNGDDAEDSVCLSLRQPEIIRGGRLDVAVSSDADTQQLDRVVAHPDFPPSFNRTPKKVDVRIDLRSGDGVEVAAALLVKMLQAIDASYPALSKQFSEPPRR